MSAPSWAMSYVASSGTEVIKKVHSSVPDPAAFNRDVMLGKLKQGKEVVGLSLAQQDDLKVKKAWEIAMGPSKSLPMNAIMSWFSGSSLQIFSLTMTFMLFSNPVKAIAGISSTFTRFESEENSARILQAKFVFVIMQLATVAVGVWKMSSMGVLPTKRSDWLAWESETVPVEAGVFIG
ncbi:uncharacterized protein V1516DRAFT_670178 [Lipomyces oligophaga]|uniref:uncharacterized protein n=1 Tax=Lipomyces oligophaga TaxID=45792 RepID=UPI0034CEE2C3